MGGTSIFLQIMKSCGDVQFQTQCNYGWDSAFSAMHLNGVSFPIRRNDGWDLNLYDDDIAGGGDIIGSHLGGFGHLQGCGQNSSNWRVSAINHTPR